MYRLKLVALLFFLTSSLMAEKHNHDNHDEFKFDEVNLEATFGAFAQYVKKQDDGNFAHAYAEVDFIAIKDNFSFAVGAYVTQELYSHNGAYDGTFEQEFNLKTFSLSYQDDNFATTLGRQHLCWIMLDDYFQGLTFSSTPVEDLELRFAAIDETAVFDPDEVVDYASIEDDNYLFAIEASYSINDAINLDALYYKSEGDIEFYGASIAYNTDFSSACGNHFHVGFYATKEDDESLLYIENLTKFNKCDIIIGYIKTGDQGVGSMTNNPWDEFDEDSYTDLAGAETFYAKGSCAIHDDINLSVIAGRTKANGVTYNQTNLTIGYDCFGCELEAGVVCVNAKDVTNEDLVKTFVSLTKEF